MGAESPRKGLGVRILVADDMPMVRRLCCSILRGAGHKVVEAEDGQGALAAYAERRPDAILLDLRMPNMDGLTVLRELRTLDPTAHVVIVTAGTDAEIREAVQLGARTVVIKPFNSGHILTALEHSFEAGAASEVKIYSWTSTVNAKAYGAPAAT
jgi:two-component system chemotaxis response regulator CheY